MKILFVGLGSIGQRHLQNLKKISKDHELFALKTFATGKIIKNFKIFGVKNLSKYYNIKILTSLDEAKKVRPDITFITNPSSFHIKTALEFAKIGSHLFIEKPLGNNLEGVNALQKIILQKKLISMVGYQTRFNPIIRTIKEIIQKNLSKVITASFEWNNFLPSYHPYEDYSKSYAAKKQLGGGVILTLIHEIDLIYYLFGLPEKIFACGGKLSDLDINVEDTMICILKYKLSNKSIPIYLNLSFAQTKEVRKFKVQFTDSTLFVDLMKNNYQLYDQEGHLIKEHKKDILRNDLFVNEIRYFLDCVKKRKNTFIDIEEGRKSLELAMKIKKSIKKGDWVK
jgi:predicted dehydrogenase